MTFHARPRVWRRLLVSLLVLAATACATAPKRIVAFGDVHGDLSATRRALRLAGAIDDQDRWIGGHLVVVQTGDQLDRGGDEQAILDLFERLRGEARKAGGSFDALLGNHEIMNVSGDLRYVTDEGFADFVGAAPFDPADSLLQSFEPAARPRMAAFLPGRPYALLLSHGDLIHIEGENVFVHGGLLPGHVAYGIDKINQETRAWLRGERDFPAILEGSGSPEWLRLYSQSPDSAACEELAWVLKEMGARRLVMGHTVQEDGISSACDGLAWRIDVGMSAAYGGSVEVLEIVGDSVRVLREKEVVKVGMQEMAEESREKGGERYVTAMAGG
ncbi:MAG: metallophosphoesterase [Gemmatimonadetes bacterium]|nr:metallophosphoesterase [Gemmatimonadota bacterium]